MRAIRARACFQTRTQRILHEQTTTREPSCVGVPVAKEDSRVRVQQISDVVRYAAQRFHILASIHDTEKCPKVMLYPPDQGFSSSRPR